MAIRNQNWYNLQSTRRYPLDDISTGLDDSGAFIREDIVVDCHIRFPAPLGEYLYVQGITVSSGIVTVVFGVVTNVAAGAGQTICAVSLPQPVEPYVNYPVTAIAPGVAGWVTFGPGVDNPFSGKYGTAIQTLVQPRNARPYRPLPIPTIGKINLGTSLQGVVNVIGTPPVTARYEQITYEDKQYPAIVFRLDSSLITNDPNYNPLSQFLSNCAQRPESGTCPKIPIETINGVSPDCNGNLDILFDGFTAINFEDCGGTEIVTDTGLDAVCREINKPKRPQEFDDLCCEPTGEDILFFPNAAAFPPAGEANKLYLAVDTNKVYRWAGANYIDTDIVLDEYCWPDPTEAIDVVIDEELQTPNYPCQPLPLCIDFGSCAPGNDFVTKTGVFAAQQTMAPPICPSCGEGEANNFGSTLTNHGTYVSAGIGSTNVAVLKNCATDWAMGHPVTVEFKLGTDGVARNGGLVLNYTQTKELNRIVTRYIALIVDGTRGKIRVLRYVNSVFTEELSINYNTKINTWYRLSGTLNLNGNNITTIFNVAEITGAHAASGTVEIVNPGPITGTVGLFANQAATFFNKFVVQ